MLFTFPLEIVTGTQKANPKREQVKLCIGVIKKISVDFPYGCAGWVGVRIFHYEHQIYPTNLDEWLVRTKRPIEFECEYEITGGPGEFKIEGYNLDDYNDHTPIITFNVLREGMPGPETIGWVEG